MYNYNAQSSDEEFSLEYCLGMIIIHNYCFIEQFLAECRHWPVERLAYYLPYGPSLMCSSVSCAYRRRRTEIVAVPMVRFLPSTQLAAIGIRDRTLTKI